MDINEEPAYYIKYYKQNRDKLLTRALEKKECECGKIITKANYSKHLKTIKHELRMRIIENKR